MKIAIKKFKAWDGKTMSVPFRLEDAAYEGFPRPVTDDNGECDIRAKITWIQFTGLEDKNAVEIFEGDLVKGWIPDSEKDEDLPIGEVRFVEAGFDIWWGYDYLGSLASCALNKSIEVIGNIYQNPELCPKQKS